MPLTLAQAMTAEFRQTVHRLPLPKFGHRVKFGNDPKKHIDFSAVTHVADDPAALVAPRRRPSAAFCSVGPATTSTTR